MRAVPSRAERRNQALKSRQIRRAKIRKAIRKQGWGEARRTRSVVRPGWATAKVVT
jgi:type I site-specific restriction endonuclease